MQMASYLKIPKEIAGAGSARSRVEYRRIESETGIRRETVSRYAVLSRANAAKTFHGSEPSSGGAHAEMSGVPGSKPAKLFRGVSAHVDP